MRTPHALTALAALALAVSAAGCSTGAPTPAEPSTGDLCRQGDSHASCTEAIVTALTAELTVHDPGTPVTREMFDRAAANVLNDRRIGPEFSYQVHTSPRESIGDSTNPVTFSLRIGSSASAYTACLGTQFRLDPPGSVCN